jgi:pimeloyl-ACP methyl ester carboxylesterase
MAAPREPVILVHGLWMVGPEFGVLRHRLQADFGFDVHVFAYSSMHGNAADIAAELADFARRKAGRVSRIHFVGHSLGGALVFRAVTEGPGDLAGNAVLLGSPLNGSRAATSVASHPMLRPLLGVHVPLELAQPCGRCWQPHPARALGAIAGNRRLGTGQFFARFDEENDGTVAVRETLIPGLDDHIVMPHSHMGMLFAHDVAAQTAHFLRQGRFLRTPASEGR